jgi:putative ABC transport system substrate-binding protein
MLSDRWSQSPNCEFRISDSGEAMNREWIDAVEIKFKSAFRNLKSAILLCALPFALSLFGVMLFAPCFSAWAQQPAKIPRIGWLTQGVLSNSPARQQAFREGLHELGYIEGKNILIEWRGADNITGRTAALAEELVRLKVEVIVTGGSGVTRVAKAATSTIPIVMASDDDPVGNGFVASLARPGGNITGLSQLAPELSGKRMEILKEVIPRLSRVAVFSTSTNASNAQVTKEIELAGRRWA